MKELCWSETTRALKLPMPRIWSERTWLKQARLWNITNLEDKLSQDQAMNALSLIAINGTSIMAMRSGKAKYWTTLKLNSSATVKISTMTWFTQSTGSKNGDAHDPSVWEQNSPSTNSTWSNHCQTPQFTLLSIHLPTCCKAIWTVPNSVFWESDMKISLTISGISFCWVRSTHQKRSLNTSWTRSENPSCIGTQWIWDAQPRTWSKTTWRCPCSIMSPFGTILSSGHKPITVTDTFKFKEKKCPNQRVISSPWLMPFNNMVPIQADLLVLWLETQLTTQTSLKKTPTPLFSNFQHSKCLWTNVLNKKDQWEEKMSKAHMALSTKFSRLRWKNRLWK